MPEPFVMIQLSQVGTNFVQNPQQTEHGIYCCYDCGHLQPLEVTHCKGCGLEKFIAYQVKEDITHVHDMPEATVVVEETEFRHQVGWAVNPPPEYLAYLRKLRSEGVYVRAIAKRVGVTANTIQVIFRRFGKQ